MRKREPLCVWHQWLFRVLDILDAPYLHKAIVGDG